VLLIRSGMSEQGVLYRDLFSYSWRLVSPCLFCFF